MTGVPSKEGGLLVGGVVRETVMIRSKTAFQMPTSEAFLTTSYDSAR